MTSILTISLSNTSSVLYHHQSAGKNSPDETFGAMPDGEDEDASRKPKSANTPSSEAASTARNGSKRSCLPAGDAMANMGGFVAGCRQ